MNVFVFKVILKILVKFVKNAQSVVIVAKETHQMIVLNVII